MDASNIIVQPLNDDKGLRFWKFNTHKREGDRTTNLRYTRHFKETGYKFTNPLENVEMIKVENNLYKRICMI